jgi:hypothetical protein
MSRWFPLPGSPHRYVCLDRSSALASSITVLELQDGVYVEVARAEGDQECRVTRPFRATIVPSPLRT